MGGLALLFGLVTLKLNASCNACPLIQNSRYITYLHVLDAEGNLIAQQDIQPFNGQFPTWAFIPGTEVTLNYNVTIPENAITPLIVRTGMYSYPAIQALEARHNGDMLPDNAIILE